MTPDRVPPAPDDAGTGPTAPDQVPAAADDPGPTTRERTGRFALGAYPLDARRARGEEMLGTLLDASDGSVGRFGREIGGLVRAGLGERAARVAGAGAPRLIADGFCLAGVWAMTLDLSVLLAQRVRASRMLCWPRGRYRPARPGPGRGPGRTRPAGRSRRTGPGPHSAGQASLTTTPASPDLPLRRSRVSSSTR